MSRSFADAIKGSKKTQSPIEPPNKGNFAWNVEAKPRVFPVERGPKMSSSNPKPGRESKSKGQNPKDPKNKKKRKPSSVVNFADITASRLPKKKVSPKPKSSKTELRVNPQKKSLEIAEFPSLSSTVNQTTGGSKTAWPKIESSSLANSKPKRPTKILRRDETPTAILAPKKVKAKARGDELLSNSLQRIKPKVDSELDSKTNDSRMNAFFSFQRPNAAQNAGTDSTAVGLMNLSNGIQKGRQRIRPRKKKFSSLKKKVLEERLRRWQQENPETTADNGIDISSSVALFGFASAEEVEDEDEYEELVENLLEMSKKVGEVKFVYVTRTSDGVQQLPSFVQFRTRELAAAALGTWNGMVLAGETLRVQSIAGKSEPTETKEAWREWCLTHGASGFDPGAIIDQTPAATVVYVENAVTEDDLEDEESLEESLADVRGLLEKFGEVINIVLEKNPKVRLAVTYNASKEKSISICDQISEQILSGNALVATSDSSMPKRQILLSNILTEDDLADEDCLAESLDDIRAIVSKFGDIHSVTLVGEEVEVALSSAQAVVAVTEMDGMIIGGSIISARLLDGDPSGNKGDAGESQGKPSKLEPMFSGDKRISERFAECKRAPKVMSTERRAYASFFDNDSIKPLLVEMLSELMRLQKRAVEEKNTKVKRRLVMGLREVARGIRSRKVKMIVMANNLDDYGVIDDKLQEILNLAHDEGLPVFFEFSKRTLGKAIGKSIKIGVLGVQNAEGAHQQFKKLVNLAAKTPIRKPELSKA